MILYPAIDIRGGQAVRLLQGDYERETAYDADPVDAAMRWAGEGAEFLHVVDLDGAKAGEPQNLEAVRRIAAAVECPIQVGGGLRDAASVDGGARGRRRAGRDRHRGAARPRASSTRALDEHGERVVVSVDARGGKVSLSGWTEATEHATSPRPSPSWASAASRASSAPTIEVDGTMEGPALDELSRIAAATDGPGDRLGRRRRPLRPRGPGPATRPPNIEGAIVGRALYERRFTVAEGIAALA